MKIVLYQRLEKEIKEGSPNQRAVAAILTQKRRITRETQRCAKDTEGAH